MAPPNRQVHIDSGERRRHADGKLVMFLAVDRVSTFTPVEFHDRAGKKEGAAFLMTVVEIFPYRIPTVLTDHRPPSGRSVPAGACAERRTRGTAFADLPKDRDGPGRRHRHLGPHIFDRVCIVNGIEHRLTKPYPPWTTAERMDRTVKTYHDDDVESPMSWPSSPPTTSPGTSRRRDGKRPTR